MGGGRVPGVVRMAHTFHLNEVFASLQGEGRNTGRPVTFIRFAGCNLSCPWCDTDRSEKFCMTLPDLMKSVEELSVPSVVITGGEPTVQAGLDELLEELKKNGCWIALETNGIIAPSRPDLFDYIAVSPKAEFANRYNERQMLKKADEVRIVCSSRKIADFCKEMRAKIEATDYYISPLSRRGRMDIAGATAMLDVLNRGLRSDPWQLSVQTHKLIGIK